MKIQHPELKRAGEPHIALACLTVISVWLLASCGGDPNARLIKAATAGNTTKAKELIESGADVNARDKEGRQTPIMFAASGNHAELARLLIEKGAEVNAKDASDWTPLLWASTQRLGLSLCWMNGR